ncbi:MAG: hypothetical protein OXR67_14905 [Chloroflexota bacterium]|nr:hypothetical protein [Chloroflexota bacterium]
MPAVNNGMSSAARDRHLRFPAPSLPNDFPVRLGRLEDRSGTSLEEMALAAGLPVNHARLWRIGRPPNDEELRTIVEFACAVPGGVAVLLLDASQPWPVRE